ncbi:MAG: glutamine-hydrolyzing carbamoyl-phosphate synthase small subunit [Chloroflexi bacterium]|nr:glutamine-hydrolyzing carbamoyl-phosphate synthase small subunit [Chloroflexota bacterium]
MAYNPRIVTTGSPTPHPQREAALALEDGSLFLGEPFGADADVAGEVVFNTGMTGYQEVASDPSYRGQMVVMTHPQIGNYGVAASGEESVRPWVTAMIVREVARHPNHWEAQDTFGGYLQRWGVPGLQGIDTRALVRRLREAGTLRGVVRHSRPGGFTAADLDALRQAARSAPSVSQLELVNDVSKILPGAAQNAPVAVLDLGAKWNILRSLEARGIQPEVFSWDTPAKQILDRNPRAILISNGPGDPMSLPNVVQAVRDLVYSGTPTLGICLGHQLIGLAAGGQTSRLHYGHHGGNHPVREERSGRVTITTQNHEFQVVGGSLPAESGFEVSHVNLNDGSVEGLRHRELPVFSVQFHPEGCPGPQDSQGLFDDLLNLAGLGSGCEPVAADLAE